MFCARLDTMPYHRPGDDVPVGAEPVCGDDMHVLPSFRARLPLETAGTPILKPGPCTSPSAICKTPLFRDSISRVINFHSKKVTLVFAKMGVRGGWPALLFDDLPTDKVSA